MDIYTVNRMTQMEHQHMTQSLRPVSEFGEHVLPPQPSRLSRFARWLLNRVATPLTTPRQKSADTSTLPHTETVNV